MTWLHSLQADPAAEIGCCVAYFGILGLTDYGVITMSKQRFSRGVLGLVIVLSVTLAFFGDSVFAGPQGPAEQAGYRIFPLKNISAGQAQKYLATAVTGTVSKLGGAQALLVTADPAELLKAKALLDLVDANEPFVVETILSPSQAAEMPSNELIAAKMGGLSLGTFASPPGASAAARAIIDRHKGAVLVVVPAALLNRVIATISELQEEARKAEIMDVLPTPINVEPNKPDISSKNPDPQPPKNTTPPNAGKIEILPPNDANKPDFPLPIPDANEPPRQEVTRQQPPEPNKPPRPTPDNKTLGQIEPDQLDTHDIYGPLPIPNGDEILTVNLPEKLDIVTLLGLAGQYLNLDFMYDPLKVKGDVTLQVHGLYRGKIRVRDLYPLLERVFKFKGFVMARGKGNLVIIVPAAETLDIDPALIDPEKGGIGLGDVVITRPFKLEHVDTTSAQNLLVGMKLGQNISPIPATGTLIVTEYAYRMARVEKLLEMLDQPGKPKEFRFRQLKYTMAKTLAPKVKTLAEQLGTISVTVATPTPTPPTRIIPGRSTPVRTIAPRTTTPPQPTSEDTVYLDADERTNRVLMIGLEDKLETVEELIDALDVEQQDLRTLKLYKIEHVDAGDARNKLAELNIIDASRATDTRSSRLSRPTGAQTPPTQPGRPATSIRTTSVTQAQSTEALVEEPQVIVIEATNSLLANATPEQHAQIETILEFVDSRTDDDMVPYVIYPLENKEPEDLAGVLEKLIQETIKDKEGHIEKVVKKTDEEIVIVPDENTFSIIVYASKKNQEWIKNLIETLDKRRPQVLIDVTLVEVSKGNKFNYDLSFIQSFPDLTDVSGLTGDPNASAVGALLQSSRDRFVDFSVSAGVGTGFYGDLHINALLTAMQTQDYGRILAKPKILVNDNQSATIGTTDTTFVKKTTSIPIASGGTNTGDLVQTAEDFEGYDAGIQLEITPHISEGNLLRLEIGLTRSDFGTITGLKPPDITTSDLNTIVTVPDGSTIILGGLTKLNQGKGGSKVPILGDLPLVGALFRGISNTDLQKKLYIFVKAEIIRPAETLAQGLSDLEKLSERNRAAFEKFEQEFQKYEDVPFIKPKPMSPIKVLDSE